MYLYMCVCTCTCVYVHYTLQYFWESRSHLYNAVGTYLYLWSTYSFIVLMIIKKFLNNYSHVTTVFFKLYF